MRIAVLANLKDNAPTWEGMPADQWDDLDGIGTINSLIQALEAGGHEAAFFEAALQAHLIEALDAYQPDLCFNIAEGHFGDGREAQIPAVLEMLGIPYTGSRVLSLALALDKPMTKRILAYHGLPTPAFQVFNSPTDPVDAELLDGAGELRFPLFVKPSREGTGMGVSMESIVTTVSDLRQQVALQMARYRQPILCERYIEGREVTVGIVGNVDEPGVVLLPPLEVDLAAYPESEGGLYTNRMKVEWVETFRYLCPAPLPQATLDELNALTAAVFRVMGCLDVARVDFRLDTAVGGQPTILEVNPLPGLNPTYSDLCIEARAAGWTYEQLINTIVDLAAARWHTEPVGSARRYSSGSL